MRRLLRKISADDLSDMGDTSTLLDPEVVQRLIKGAAEIRNQGVAGPSP